MDPGRHGLVGGPMISKSVPMLVALAIAGADVAAAPRNGRGAACEPLGLNLSTRQEHLSQLLQELSAVRTFRLEDWSHEDPIVTPTGTNDLELMTALSGQVNLVVRYASAKDCPGRWKIDTVWILPGKPEASARTVVPAPVIAAPPAELNPAEVMATKAATEMFLRAHGMPGSDTAVKP